MVIVMYISTTWLPQREIFKIRVTVEDAYIHSKWESSMLATRVPTHFDNVTHMISARQNISFVILIRVVKKPNYHYNIKIYYVNYIV